MPKGRKTVWPAKAPRKGSKNRRLIIRAIHGFRSKEIKDDISPYELGQWISTMLNEKGIEIKRIKGVFILTGFYRRNGRYRETPGFPARVEKILLRD